MRQRLAAVLVHLRDVFDVWLQCCLYSVIPEVVPSGAARGDETIIHPMGVREAEQREVRRAGQLLDGFCRVALELILVRQAEHLVLYHDWVASGELEDEIE